MTINKRYKNVSIQIVANNGYRVRVVGTDHSSKVYNVLQVSEGPLECGRQRAWAAVLGV